MEENINRVGSKLHINNHAKSGDFIIGSQDKLSGGLTISANPMIQSFESATKEAARLAKANPNKSFIVMEFRGVCSFQDVTWS